MTKDTVLLQFLFGGIDSPNYNLTKSKLNIFDYIHIHTYIHIYIYIYSLREPIILSSSYKNNSSFYSSYIYLIRVQLRDYKS